MAGRIAATCPDAKLIIMRNPVDRINWRQMVLSRDSLGATPAFDKLVQREISTELVLGDPHATCPAGGMISPNRTGGIFLRQYSDSFLLSTFDADPMPRWFRWTSIVVILGFHMSTIFTMQISFRAKMVLIVMRLTPLTPYTANCVSAMRTRFSLAAMPSSDALSRDGLFWLWQNAISAA